ncbi:MAG: glycosyltransferase [Deltaproteobacteria bacterium]
MSMHAASEHFRLSAQGDLPRFDLALSLVGEGLLSISELAQMNARARAAGKHVVDLLLASGQFAEDDVLRRAARHLNLHLYAGGCQVDSVRLGVLGKATCRALGIVPVISAGGMHVLLVSKPWNLPDIRLALPDLAWGAHLMLVDSDRFEALLAESSGIADLTDAESCRGWNVARLRRRALLLALGLAGATVFAPAAVLLSATAIALFSMCAVTALKALAAVAMLTERRTNLFATRRADHPSDPLVSLLVPLYHEGDIAGRLVERLSRLNRPRELLEVLLVVENDDHDTLQRLRDASLAPHFRIIVVPDGPIRTKPRAMNHALGFARGDIIGIYDAEDQPDPRQITAVVEAFARAGPDVACVQGQLDFYNTDASWITRAFTLDYAAWFRVVLPGIARLGLVVPLGGTTLFFRRDAVERLGGWDAWNVTEDADLGLRLARNGWRCEVIATTTHEEAVASVRPWVKQRSRWLKGYAMTWATHMRDPVALWRDLGAWRFVGVQAQFLLTLVQFVAAPLLWSFWLIAFSDIHPLEHLLTSGQLFVLFWLFVSVSVLDAGVQLLGLFKARKMRLWPMIPLMQFYFLLGSVAAYRGLIEMLIRPYHWEKTSHGQSLPPVSAKPGFKRTADMGA